MTAWYAMWCTRWSPSSLRMNCPCWRVCSLSTTPRPSGVSPVGGSGAYFRVPDPEAQSARQALGTQSLKGSQDCERALKQQDGVLFVTAMRELTAAGNSAATPTRRITTVPHEAGYAGY
ncbi:hypothetical protein OG413_26805 [Streptomyces sp. NBC_01433]|uniref:hypothetical protein n=1 Tax=Streptomyces sp. NBC_01433 TaxID=2903864 RepID=UPI0022521E41|nr:hypothetical protein [Streptomyces sp. NBC_01433]MCX4678875.1 hypothetical protein [Streptomyces sp. NBC_01433]